MDEIALCVGLSVIWFLVAVISWYAGFYQGVAETLQKKMEWKP